MAKLYEKVNFSAQALGMLMGDERWCLDCTLLAGGLRTVDDEDTSPVRELYALVVG